MTNNRDIICAAIQATVESVPGYFQKTCEQRLPGGAGSVLTGEFGGWNDVREALENAEWTAVQHPDLMPGTRAFSTHDLRGRLGIVDLAALDDSDVVTLDDRKNTGKVSCTVNGVLGPEVDHVVIILGDEAGREVVFTFHPGDPVRPSQVSCEPGMHGRTVTVAEAREMGLTTAKIVA